MPRFEYLELDLYGDSGTQKEPNLNEGDEGYIRKLNAYGALGWRVINVDVDTSTHCRFILEREIPGGI